MGSSDLEQQILAAKRLLAIDDAKRSLLSFQKWRMPDPEYQDDPDHSQYQETPVARLLCEALERVAEGRLLRLAVSIPPQCGKSEIITKGFPAWLMGQKPYLNLMCGTYNQDFANDFGDEVRNIITSPLYQTVFPKTQLRTGSKAKDFMKTTAGGKLSFLGRQGSGTGKAADGFIVDDPIKDDADAQSATNRNQVWNWFNKVAFTRCHTCSFIVVVHTRWHEDDLIGRLCDTSHPDHDPEVAKLWTYINVPAVVSDPDLAKALGLELAVPTENASVREFGSEPMAALWEERKPLHFLAEARRMDKRGFEALYQGNPSPDDGDYFTKDMLVTYQMHELPKRLRMFGASDHATTTKTRSDSSCLGCAGVDEAGDLWIMPDLVWDKFETDRTVEEIIMLMKRHKPGLWWAENEHISQGFGPFLRKRQRELGANVTMFPITVNSDKRQTARSIQGMMSLGRVHFPAFAPWWSRAEAELLKFDNGAHDDFVSFISMLGLGLDSEQGPGAKLVDKFKDLKVGTFGWIKQQAGKEARAKRLTLASGGM